MIDIPHFHPNTHECYGDNARSRPLSAEWLPLTRQSAIFRGRSRLALGREIEQDSPSGVEIDVQSGDVIVVPAGVSHRSISSEGDYRYIGVYPWVCLLRSAAAPCSFLTFWVSKLPGGGIISARARKIWACWSKRCARLRCRLWTQLWVKMDLWFVCGLDRPRNYEGPILTRRKKIYGIFLDERWHECNNLQCLAS